MSIDGGNVHLKTENLFLMRASKLFEKSVSQAERAWRPKEMRTSEAESKRSDHAGVGDSVFSRTTCEPQKKIFCYISSYSLIINWELICLIVSRATETTIKRAVPPIVKIVIPVTIWVRFGKIAIKPKNKAPERVKRLIIFERKPVVESPGLMPATNPPERWRFLDISFGSKVTAV